MTREEIITKLKSMVVGEDGRLPISSLNYVLENKDYDPEHFSQEIEDSEEYDDVYKRLTDWVKEGHDILLFDKSHHNSEEWLANHTKNATITFVAFSTLIKAEAHPTEDGNYIHDYNSEENVDKILKYQEIYGRIIDFN